MNLDLALDSLLLEPSELTWHSSGLPLLLGEAREMLERMLGKIRAGARGPTLKEASGGAAAEGASLEALDWLRAFSLVMPEMPVESGALFGGI